MATTMEATWRIEGAHDGLPPGPRLPAILQAIQRVLRPIDFLESCARRYGDCFTLRLPGLPPEVVFSDPEAVKEIFTGDADALRAGESNRLLEPILGSRSLLLLDGVSHLRERRLMLPPFHGERMQAYGQLMEAIAARAIDGWPIGRPFRLHPAMQRLTLEVIMQTVFGVREGALLDRLRDVLSALLAIAANPMWLMPWLQRDLGRASPWGRFLRLRREAHALLLGEIAARRAAGAGTGDDVLSLLLSARDETGATLDDVALRDEMMTLLLAGHETTATALAWMAHQLLAHRDVLARVREELERVVGDGPLPAHVGRLEYLDAAVKETLRLRPVLPEVGRLLYRPVRIGGRDLPAGVVAVPSIYLAHRRPDRWPEPARFRPERFLGTRPGAYEFFPFGGGVRRCLGMAFALYEMKIVVAAMLTRVRLAPVPGVRIRPVRRSITLAPARGMPVMVERLDRRSS